MWQHCFVILFVQVMHTVLIKGSNKYWGLFFFFSTRHSLKLCEIFSAPLYREYTCPCISFFPLPSLPVVLLLNCCLVFYFLNKLTNDKMVSL
uniref:MSTP081 n=1 Tax=Homo sapiens TaxID=9606 RepID=Q7Z4F6_HUMAN|nr:MSTP081 [Homo sapiens]